MRKWFNGLPPDEQDRRRRYTDQFEPHYRGFRARRLGTVRHIVEHRGGVAPVTVTISGLFGVTYTGSPT
ncbi:MAG: hypothetical protein ABSE69_06435, partial [Roseiarcus sp.]